LYSGKYKLRQVCEKNAQAKTGRDRIKQAETGRLVLI